MSGPRTVAAAWAVALALAGVSLWGLVAERARVAATSTDDAITEAARAIAADLAEGDAVLVLPLWEEAAWHVLEGEAAGPMRPPYPALMRGSGVDPVDLLRFRRVWVLGAHGRAPAVDSWLTPEDAELQQVRSIDASTQVALFTLRGSGVLSTLTESLADVEARRRLEDGTLEACPRAGRRFDCGRKGWLDPTLEHRNVHHRDRRWLYAHPGPDAGALVLTWRHLPSEATAAIVRAGFTQSGVRHDVGSPTTVAVRVGGRDATSFVLEPHVYALETAVLDLGGDPGHLEVEIQAADPRWREVMLEIDLLRQVPTSVLRVSGGGR